MCIRFSLQTKFRYRTNLKILLFSSLIRVQLGGYGQIFVKRPLPSDAAGTSRPLRLRQDNGHISRVCIISPAEINLDDLPPDPADRKRIS